MSSGNPKPVEPEVVDMEERNWLPRHSRGDTRAFECLLQAYKGLVFSFLWRYGVDRHSRDDLFQEVFLRIHQAASRYRSHQPLRPWIVTIVLNTVRNHRRDQLRKNRFSSHLRAVTKHQASTHQDQGAEQMLEQQSTLRWLETRIARLPDRQREILVLFTLKGLSTKDIARAMGMPVNTVKTHLRRARLALAEDLDRREAPEKIHEHL
jgi:RNA polymerase sigma-70 factor (ECF subfamily)